VPSSASGKDATESAAAPGAATVTYYSPPPGIPRLPRYVAFDLELVANVVSEDVCAPAIACGALQAVADTQMSLLAPEVFHSGLPGARDRAVESSAQSTPPAWTPQDVRDFVDTLWEYVERGYMVVTWGGMRSDWWFLADNCGRDEATLTKITRMALWHHIDVPFLTYCASGHCPRLEGAAAAMKRASHRYLAPQKNGVLDSLKAADSHSVPDMWAKPWLRHAVLAHVQTDAAATLELALEFTTSASIAWLTHLRRMKRVKLPVRVTADGSPRLLVTMEALSLPPPRNVHWRVDPASSFHWLSQHDRKQVLDAWRLMQQQYQQQQQQQRRKQYARHVRGPKKQRHHGSPSKQASLFLPQDSWRHDKALMAVG
jgi:hypothetical protein